MTFLKLIPNPEVDRPRRHSMGSSANYRASVSEWLLKNQNHDHDAGNDAARKTPISRTHSHGQQQTPPFSSSSSSWPFFPPSPSPRSPNTTTTESTQTKLFAAIEKSRESETLHAYDVGVYAALQSMAQFWRQRAKQPHVSVPEKRIFQREAQRLTELMGDAEREMMVSNARLMRKQQVEQRLWEKMQSYNTEEDVERGGENNEEGDDRKLWETETVSELILGTPLGGSMAGGGWALGGSTAALAAAEDGARTKDKVQGMSCYM
ncbi:hypothetical protein B0T22DRAFT_521533 [Podospora appendiculata]|uniref:Uncharacterized protein n=1 Tax=Podospora appendiculata TaxID=314037 RepID=A0AAE1C823_9PEZI|nr:hypothetical protein B0T22DRAFT_521533 [Podospora appendiculata]